MLYELEVLPRKCLQKSAEFCSFPLPQFASPALLSTVFQCPCSAQPIELCLSVHVRWLRPAIVDLKFFIDSDSLENFQVLFFRMSDSLKVVLVELVHVDCWKWLKARLWNRLFLCVLGGLCRLVYRFVWKWRRVAGRHRCNHLLKLDVNLWKAKTKEVYHASSGSLKGWKWAPLW